MKSNDKSEIKWKAEVKGAQQKKIINLGYIDHFGYKLYCYKKILIYSRVIWLQHILMKQFWDIQFITLKVSVR